MPNGFSDHDSGQPSGGDQKQPPAALFDDGVDDETFNTDDTRETQALPDASDFSVTEALEAEVEPVGAPHTKHHFKQLIEARREAKRLDALLREVYDED